jgi:hypothetical protein
MSFGWQQMGSFVITSIHFFMKFSCLGMESAFFAPIRKAARPTASSFQQSAELNDPQQVQNDEDDGNNE